MQRVPLYFETHWHVKKHVIIIVLIIGFKVNATRDNCSPIISTEKLCASSIGHKKSLSFRFNVALHNAREKTLRPASPGEGMFSL
jgi:hypothetical protein